MDYETARELVLSMLENAFLGDRLAAEYTLLHLLSTGYVIFCTTKHYGNR